MPNENIFEVIIERLNTLTVEVALEFVAEMM